MNKNYFLSKH